MSQQGHYTTADQQTKVDMHPSKKLYNPKSHAPALYIPNWLSQVTSKELSYSSKMVYGRIAQWSQANGTAHRSAKQIGIEIGMPLRTVERSIKELKDECLMGTCIPISGGHNHFEFYHHEWMDRPIVRELCYKSALPPAKMAVPPANLTVPPAKMAVHKIKVNINNKIKKINNKRKNPASTLPPDTKVSSYTKRVGKKMVESSLTQATENQTMAEYQETLFPMPAETKPSNSKDLSTEVKKPGLMVGELEALNPHHIPAEMIKDWLEVRKSKRSPVTATAWKRINNQLAKCADPVEAFEIMVSHGWSALNHTWIANIKKDESKKGHFDYEDDTWAETSKRSIF